MSRAHRAQMVYSRAMRADPYLLYEAAVQDVDFDLELFSRVYRRERGTGFDLLREDFCGTARLAATWVRRKASGRAWAIDLNPRPLAWARAHHVPLIGAAARRLRLIQGDVRRVRTPRVDVIAALNCSYWIFQERSALVGYLRRGFRALLPGGMMFVDAFGGEGAMRPLTERRHVSGMRTWAGARVPPFTYEWEQKSFNPIDHRLVASIHFELERGRHIRDAFRYDWRMWSIPEIAEALRQAGFVDVQVHVQSWPLGVYRRRARFENQEGWLAYVVGVK